jgi:surfactin synthase thioesterase subunit
MAPPSGADIQASSPGGWFACLEPRAEARARVYVFPHAGAGPGALGALAAELPESIELWALNLPGRQVRRDEAPRTELEPLIEEVAADLTEAPGYHALFGYCGGALLAYLTARRSRPGRLFVASFAAPDLALISRRLHTLPGDLFWEMVLAQGGVPPELAALTELRPVFEPALRADFGLYAGYLHHRAEPLDVPITVLYGRDDTDLSLGGLLGWRRQSTVRPDLCDVPGGHWLVDEDPAGVAARLAGRIMADLPLTAARPE